MKGSIEKTRIDFEQYYMGTFRGYQFGTLHDLYAMSLLSNFDKSKKGLVESTIREYVSGGGNERFHIDDNAYDKFGNLIPHDFALFRLTGKPVDLGDFWDIYRRRKNG